MTKTPRPKIRPTDSIDDSLRQGCSLLAAACLCTLLLILALLLAFLPRGGAPEQLGPQWETTLVKVTMQPPAVTWEAVPLATVGAVIVGGSK